MDDYTFPFEKLDVWQLAVDFADNVLKLTDSMNPNRHIRLISQMEAAAASVAQNIAEGKGRQHDKEFVQYLYISQGSLFEVLTLTVLFERRGLLSSSDAGSIRAQSTIIHRKINGLINAVKSRISMPD